MPSQLHEALLLLFRNRPTLAPELLDAALHVTLPRYSEARIESAELTDIQPAEYRADLVVLLLQGKPVLGIVVEVQLANDPDKRYVWPVYVANLRARIRCPVCLLVVAADESVARWAATPIELGGNSRLTPWVLPPSAIPEITDETQARQDPELAVLSALAHGKDADIATAARIGRAAHLASLDLDAERARLYLDLVMNALPEAARRALMAMDPAKYEYQSEFAKRFISVGRAEGKAEGKAEGEAQGRAAVLLRQLTSRFGPIPEWAQARLRQADIEALDALADRVLAAGTLEDVLGPSP